MKIQFKPEILIIGDPINHNHSNSPNTANIRLKIPADLNIENNSNLVTGWWYAKEDSRRQCMY